MNKNAFAAFLCVALAACSGSTTSTPLVTSLPNQSLHPASISVTGTYATGITAGAAIDDITAGPDGRMWFTEFNASKIGAITTAGVVTEYANANPSYQPNGIVKAPGPTTWAGGFGGTLIKSAADGWQTYYPISGAHIDSLTVGPDSKIWFTDYGNNKVGRSTTAFSVVEFPLGAGALPGGGIASSGGYLWILDAGNHKVIKMNTSGTIVHRYSGMPTNKWPEEIVAAPDGNMYFTLFANSSTVPDGIARIKPNGVITEIKTLGYQGYPDRLTVGKDNNVYFVFIDKKLLGKIDLSTGTVTLHSIHLANDQGAAAIAPGPDGRLWLGGHQTVYAVSY